MADNEGQEASSEHTSTSGGRPAAVFNGSGGIQVAVWKNKSETGRDYFSIKIERSYKGSDEEYHSTQYLREGDLLRTQKLLDQADAWIEQQRSKQRASSSPSR